MAKGVGNLPARLGFLASHGGSGARAVAQACWDGELPAEPVALVSNNSRSAALAWAQQRGLEYAHFSEVGSGSAEALDRDLLTYFLSAEVDIIVLSGYMKVLGPQLLDAYAGRVLNIHPSLLPKFGGPGMYGDRVHQAVLDAQEQESGATVHLVTGGVDEGPILAQSNVPVFLTDSLEALRTRVQATEGPLYVRALRRYLQEQPTIPGRG